MLNQGKHLLLITCILQTICFLEINEINVGSVGSVTQVLGNSCLSRSFWSNHKDGLWQDGIFALSIDITDASSGINSSDFTKSFIIINDWDWLIKVLLNSLLDGLSIVIISATSFSSLHAPLNHGLLWNLIVEHLLSLNNLLLEKLGLVHSSWESVDKIIL